MPIGPCKAGVNIDTRTRPNSPGRVRVNGPGRVPKVPGAAGSLESSSFTLSPEPLILSPAY